MAAVALFMVGRLAKFNDIFTSTVPTINNFSNHALKINCLTLFVQLKIQNNILFLYTTPFFGRIEQKLALSGSFYQRHPVDYKIFIFLGQPLDSGKYGAADEKSPIMPGKGNHFT